MPINENMVQEIVQEVMAKMQIADAPTGKHGIFKEMNDAIEAAKKSQLIVKKMSMDQREKIITCIRKKIKENAEVMARMGVEETGMGNVGDKILKHHLVADKTPGTEVITTTAWSGDRGLTLIEMGPFGVIGAIIPLVMLYFMYDKAVSYVMTRYSLLNNIVDFLPVRRVYRTLLPVGIALGVGIGFLGSTFTIRKHLKV